MFRVYIRIGECGAYILFDAKSRGFWAVLIALIYSAHSKLHTIANDKVTNHASEISNR